MLMIYWGKFGSDEDSPAIFKKKCHMVSEFLKKEYLFPTCIFYRTGIHR